MKTNYDFYTGKDTYSDGDVEQDILKYLEQYGEENYKEIFEKDVRWPVFYHITPIRKNILNWYEFKENAEALEIGAGMGAVTGALCDKVSHVTAVELSKQRASAIEIRCKDKQNLELIVGNFNDIKFDKKFDYITLIGVLEYAPLYTNSENPYEDFLKKIKGLLKKDGKLIIAIENQFGLKYFSGVSEDHTNKIYDGITGYENKKGIRTFGKNQLKDILKKVGFTNTKFYYPMPDYKLPNIIFSDDYLPDENTINQYQPYLSNEDAEAEYDEKQAYKDIIKNNQFGFFANSFFIEASQEKIDTKIDLSKQNLVQIDDSMKGFYEKHYKIKQKNENMAKQPIEEKGQVIKEELNNKIRKHLSDYKMDKDNTNIELMLALSEIRENIVNWYSFEKDAEILEIGANYGEITGYLCSNCKKVTSIELSKEKANIVAERHSDKENLDCIVGNLEDISIDKKFDYIVIIGQLEKASKWLPHSLLPEEDLLRFVSNLLKDNGKILIATDNKFGMKYWSGKIDLEGTLEYKNLTEDRTPNGSKLFSEMALKKMIEKVGYKNYKFYYAFPDYKMPNLIYEKEYQITEEDITRNFQYYEANELTNFKENEVYLQIFKGDRDKLNFFANSFFIEMGREKIQNNVKYVAFSNYRKEEYRVMTLIDENSVIKKAASKKAKNHINNIAKNNLLFNKKYAKIVEKEENGNLVSQYIRTERFDIMLENSSEEEVLRNFKKYTDILYQDSLNFNEIKDKSRLNSTIKGYDENKLEKMKFSEYSYLDFIPKNCFLINGEFQVFDQEWVENYFPIEYIIYRAIQNTNLTEKNKEMLRTEYHITENNELFEQLEKELREKMIDNVMLEEIFYRKTINRKEIVDTMIHYKNLKNIAEEQLKGKEGQLKEKEKIIRRKEEEIRVTSEQLRAKEEEIKEKEETVRTQGEEIKNQKEELEGIYSSRSWKLTAPLRKIKEKL